MTASRTADRRQGAGSKGQLPRTVPRSAFRLQRVLVGSGLAGLLGVTACALASVSAWLAPAYLLVVVAILTAPRGERASPRRSAPHPVPLPAGARAIVGFLRNGLTALRRRSASPSPHWGEGARRADEGPDSTATTDRPGHRPGAESDPALAAGASDDGVEARLRVDAAAPAVSRPRRSRTRSRKAAKPAAEPVADSSAVTWIRVGPGKYVRSDVIGQVAPSAEAPPPVEVPVEVVAPEPEVAPSPETTPPEPATETVTVPEPEVVLEPLPAAEEDGIAPSAFGAVASVVRGPWSAVELSLSTGSAKPPSRGPTHAHRRRPARRRTWDHTPWTNRRRRGRRVPGRPRVEVRGLYAIDPRRAGAARRASARTEHVRRDRRARSPPA
jgi:hypothetical protein